MAYFNGKNIAFGVTLMGSLDPEMTQFAETMKKWLTLDPEGEETYDMVFPDWVRNTIIENYWIPNTCEKLISYNGDIAFDFELLFDGHKALETVYFPKCTQTSTHLFRNCLKLKTITLGAVSNFNKEPFRGCSAIENFTIGAGTTANRLDLSPSTVLTVESMQGVIDNYADLSSGNGAVIVFGATNLAKLSDEYKQKAVTKGLILI